MRVRRIDIVNILDITTEMLLITLLLTLTTTDVVRGRWESFSVWQHRMAK